MVSTKDLSTPDATIFKGVDGEWLGWENQTRYFHMAWHYHLPKNVQGKDWVSDVLERELIFSRVRQPDLLLLQHVRDVFAMAFLIWVPRIMIAPMSPECGAKVLSEFYISGLTLKGSRFLTIPCTSRTCSMVSRYWEIVFARDSKYNRLEKYADI